MPSEKEWAVIYRSEMGPLELRECKTAEEVAPTLAEVKRLGFTPFVIQIRRSWPAARSEAEGQVPTTAPTAPTALDCDGFTKPRRTL